MTPGKGADRMGGKADGIKWTWKWHRQCDLSWSYGDPKLKDKRRLPCQVCFADLPLVKSVTQRPGFGDSCITFSVVLWGSDATEYWYEGDVLVNDNNILNTKVFTTRIEAQKGAEELLRQFCEGALKILENSND